MSIALSSPKRNPLAPVPMSDWLRDEDISYCCGCQTGFGLFTRRHHCLTEEQQILTNKGFMDLKQIIKEVPHLLIDEDQPQQPHQRQPPKGQSDLLFASYDHANRSIVYNPASCVVVKSVDELVELTHQSESRRWSESANEFGETNPNSIESTHDKDPSNHISVVVDPSHDMWVKTGRASATGGVRWDVASDDAARPLTRPAITGAANTNRVELDWSKKKAHMLVTKDPLARVKMLSAATNGVDASGDTAQFAQPLNLATKNQQDAFLKIYGYWLGAGSIDADNISLTFSTKTQDNKRWLKKLLSAIGLCDTSDSLLVDRQAIRVTQPAWFSYFLQAPNQPANSCFEWVWQLRKEQIRMVLNGLRRASGREASSESESESEILTSSIHFRDEIQRMALHAGYTAHFSRARDSINAASPTVWRVTYSSSISASESTLVNSRDITRRAVPAGVRVWCPTVEPFNTIIVRRVGTNDAGEVTRASKPLIIGNCRLCGRIFCGRCSDRKWDIEGHASRVCDGCHLTLAAAAAERLRSQDVAQYEKDATSQPPSPQQAVTTMGECPDGHTLESPAKSAMAIAQQAREAVERIIYHTASLCPKCALIDKRGFDDYKPAQLFEQYRGIWLRLQCHLHGPHITLVCKERNFWWRCHSYQERWVAALKSSGLVPEVPASIHQGIAIDMEDIGKMLAHTLRSAAPPADNLPLSFELNLYVNGEFVSDRDLDTRLLSFVRKFPNQGKGSTFLLKLQGGLVDKHEIALLNDKILRIVAMANPSPNAHSHAILTPALTNVRIVVDVTYERLVDLLLLDKSCFLKVRVLPCARYFLGRGEEESFIAEMTYLISLVRDISDLELVLSLSLESPYPDMMKILQFIKSQKGVIRFILLSRERSPRDILHRLHEEIDSSRNAAPMPGLASQTSPNLSSYPESTDPFELLEALDAGTNGLLRPSDFVPMAIAQIFEPALQAFGYGSYHINPSPFCGFVATLVTTEKLQSIPVTRLFDIEQLYTLLVPIAQKLKYSKEKPTIGITIAKQIQKALKSCAYNVETPDVVSYVASGAIDKSKSATIQTFVRNLQMFVIHNRMDFASIDLARRCRCANVTNSPLDQTQQIAMCTGCI